MKLLAIPYTPNNAEALMKVGKSSRLKYRSKAANGVYRLSASASKNRAHVKDSCEALIKR